jgi:hypothetical protein
METIFTALFVIGTVWGGVIFFLRRAIKFEKNKKEIPE